ncbi:MAG TPA: hypothetical protein VMF89_26010, partial [Polyangiales bacterium]|nr:hypothetical protein [Polyangiales bacterium]
VLSGKIDVLVKIKFLFFSKSWRAHLAKFNGFCTPANPKPFCNLDLFGGYGTVASIPFEMVDWGTVLMPTKFLGLKRFKPQDYRAAGYDSVSTGRAGALFYDSLCTCIPHYSSVPPAEQSEVKECTKNGDCCEDDDFCFNDPAIAGFGTCSSCRALAESCNGVSDCCPATGSDPLTCLVDPADSARIGHCKVKSKCLQPCSVDEDCNDGTPFGDLYCFTPTVSPSDPTPLPEQRNCRRVSDNSVQACVDLM